MLRILANDHDAAFALNDLALIAHALNGWFYFHPGCTLLVKSLETVCYTAACQIVRRQLDRDFIARKDADEIHPYLTRHMCQHDVAIFQLDLEHRIRQCLQDLAFYFDYILLRHVTLLLELGWANVI